MFRVGLYARVSMNDQQTLAMQNRAMREYAARRGWTIAMQVREVNSGAARREAREKLLEAAGFMVLPFQESHLCCGSAGTYSILQPELSGRLRRRKLGNIMAANPELLASGNIGCLQHLAAAPRKEVGGELPPILHIAELLDWAEGGPVPPGLGNLAKPAGAH